MLTNLLIAYLTVSVLVSTVLHLFCSLLVIFLVTSSGGCECFYDAELLLSAYFCVFMCVLIVLAYNIGHGRVQAYNHTRVCPSAPVARKPL